MPLSSAVTTAERIALELAKSSDGMLHRSLNTDKLLEWCKRVYGTDIAELQALRTEEASSPAGHKSDSRHHSPVPSSLLSREQTRCITSSDVAMEDSGRHGLGELYHSAPGDVVVLFPSSSAGPQYVSSVSQRSEPQPTQMQLQQVLLPLLSSCHDKADRQHEDDVCIIRYPSPSQQVHTVKAYERGTYRLSVDNMGCGSYESVEEAVSASVRFRACSAFPPAIDISSEYDLAGIHYSLKHDMYRLVWEGVNLGLYESVREALAAKLRVIGGRSQQTDGVAADVNAQTHAGVKRIRHSVDVGERGHDQVGNKQLMAGEGHFTDCSAVEEDESQLHDQPVDWNTWPKQLLQAATASNQRAGLSPSSAGALKVLSNAAQALVILGQAQAAGPAHMSDSRAAQHSTGALTPQNSVYKEDPGRIPPHYVPSSSSMDANVPHLTIRLQSQSAQANTKLPLTKSTSGQLNRSAGSEWNPENEHLPSRQGIRWPVTAPADDRSTRIHESLNMRAPDNAPKYAANNSSQNLRPHAAFSGSPVTATEAPLRCKVKAVKNNKFELYVENRYFGIFPSRETAETMAQQVHSMSWQDVWAFKEQRAASREARRHKKIEALAALASGASSRRDQDESEGDDPCANLMGASDRNDQGMRGDDLVGANPFLNLNTNCTGMWQPPRHSQENLLPSGQPGDDSRRGSGGMSNMVHSQALPMSTEHRPTPMDTDGNVLKNRKETPRRLPCCMRLNRKLLKFELLVNGTYFGLFDTREEAEAARQAIRNMTWEEVCEFRKKFVRGKCRSKPAGQILMKAPQVPLDLNPPLVKVASQSSPPATPTRSSDLPPEDVSDSPMPELPSREDGSPV